MGSGSLGLAGAVAATVYDRPAVTRKHHHGPVASTAVRGLACERGPAVAAAAAAVYPHRGHAVLIDAVRRHRIVRLLPTLPSGNGRTVRVQAISWR
jgi:hypothetical protein